MVALRHKAHILVRFFAKVKFDMRTGCWIWRGAHDGWGYGNMRLGVRFISAHKFAFLAFRGKVPPGRELDHVVCDSPTCANPFHVEPRTHRENVLRSNCPAAINARKKRCIRGHRLAGTNLAIRRTGGRRCRKCEHMRRTA